MGKQTRTRCGKIISNFEINYTLKLIEKLRAK